MLVPFSVMDAYATGVLYASDRDGNLFIVNVGTGTFTPAGNFGPSIDIFSGNPGTTEIECTPDGLSCFSQVPDGSFEIEPFDIFIPSVTGPPVTILGAFTGLEYVGGVLFGTFIVSGGGFSPSTLATVDPLTGNFVPIGLTGVGPIAGLAFDTNAGIMYGIAGGPGPTTLYTIALGSGLATPVGTENIQTGSLQFGPDGLLYAGGTGTSTGDVFIISKADASSTLFGNIGTGNGVTGLTLVEVTKVGGEIIPIETTSLILAGAQSFSWMIPVVLSVLGIGLFVVSRKSE